MKQVNTMHDDHHPRGGIESAHPLKGPEATAGIRSAAGTPAPTRLDREHGPGTKHELPKDGWLGAHERAVNATTGQEPDAQRGTKHSAHGQDRSAAPEHEVIACRAYDIYIKSGRLPGRCDHNWNEAEHELRTLQIGSKQ